MRIEFAGASYVPGQKARMRLIVEDPAASRWGFQLTARPESNPQTAAGKLTAIDGNAEVLAASGLEWITHTTPGTRRGTRDSVAFEFDWTAPATDTGAVVFYAAANAANGNNGTSGDSIYTATLRVAAETGAGARPSFSAGSVTEAYTAKAGMAPGAWVTIQGTELAGREAYGLLETQLGGVRVKVNDVPAALSFVSPSKITMLVPGGTPEGEVPVVIERDGTAAAPVMVRVSAATPAVHAVGDGKGGYFAAVTPAGAGTSLSLIAAKGWILGKAEADSRALRGVYPGEQIDIYAIGLGRTEGSFPTSAAFGNPLPLSVIPTVRFGETGVTPSFAAMVAPGMYVVRVQVPESLAPGDIPLTLDSGGATSASNVLLTVSPRP